MLRFSVLSTSLVIALLLAVGVYALLRWGRSLERRAQAESARDIDDAILDVLAKSTGYPKEELQAAKADPEHHQPFIARVQQRFIQARLAYKRHMGGVVRVTVVVYLKGDGPGKVRKVTTEWDAHWDELPDPVRAALLRRGEDVEDDWPTPFDQAGR